MSGDNQAAKPIVWGVVVESRRTHLVDVVLVEDGWTVPGWCSGDGTNDPVTARTQREIVLRWAMRCGWPVVELVAPGDKPRVMLEHEAEGAREEASCAWDKLNETRTRLEIERDTARADNTALRAELDDLRGRLSRTANRIADLERASAALMHDAVLSAIRRGPVVSVCATCHEERTRWCEGCGFCEATCCACPSDEGSAA